MSGDREETRWALSRSRLKRRDGYGGRGLYYSVYSFLFFKPGSMRDPSSPTDAPGMESAPPAVEAWTAREVPVLSNLA